MSAVNHRPFTPLPWEDPATALSNPEYALHAINAYPDLVMTLRAILFQVIQGKVLERDACIGTARALLTKLGEEN